jgi:hypothetical protein
MWNFLFGRRHETPLRLAASLLDQKVDELMAYANDAQALYKASRGQPSPAESKAMRAIDACAWQSIKDCQDVVARRLLPMAAGSAVELQGLISLAVAVVKNTFDEMRDERRLRPSGSKEWSLLVESIQQRHYQLKGLAKALRNFD